MMTKLELIELIILIVVAVGLGIYYLIKAIKNGWIQKITTTMNEAIKYLIGEPDFKSFKSSGNGLMFYYDEN